jgi:hypothetical protein
MVSRSEYSELTLRLASMKSQFAAASFWLRASLLRELITKAGFRADQPRIPAGHSDGGQWTADPDGSMSRPILPAGDNPDLEPNIPDKRPETASERNTLAQRFARYWFNQPQGLAVRTLLRTAWLLNDAGDAIQAFFDGPRSLEELQDAVSDPRRGYDIHHIVEQGSAREDGFSNTEINGAGNLVRIPRYRHWQINGWFGKSNASFGELSPRQYLRGKSWSERYRVGLMALRMHGVLR